jgi:membrane fusion protein (multidrug efflux system)
MNPMNTRQTLLMLSIAVLFTACQKHEQVNEEAPAKLEVSSPLQKDTSIAKEYVCQIHAYRHIELRALERGYIQGIFVDEGQTLKQGQPMFKIMPTVYQADLQKAKAEANMVEIEYQNTKALAEKNIVSPNELALAKAKLEKAKAEVSIAQTHLGFTDINAPFSGIMDHLEVRNGSLVAEGDLLTTLSDISKMWVYFNVPEAEYLNFKTHQEEKSPTKVKLKLANGEIFNQDGVVETVEADFDNKTGNIEFRAAFPNPAAILRHGQTGNIVMQQGFPNALIIPQKATFEILDKRYVYVLKADNSLEQRLIEIAGEQPYVYLVKSGLKPNDRILLEGLRKVHPGQKVTPNFIPPEKELSQLGLQAE